VEAAIDQRDGHIYNRITKRTFACGFLGGITDGGNEVAGDRATNDFVDELEALTARPWCNINLNVGELAMTASLAFQPSMFVHRFANGFLVSD
jgi:hypothetical protein